MNYVVKMRGFPADLLEKNKQTNNSHTLPKIAKITFIKNQNRSFLSESTEDFRYLKWNIKIDKRHPQGTENQTFSTDKKT